MIEAEKIMAALVTQVTSALAVSLPGAVVSRSPGLPEKVPAGGLIQIGEGLSEIAGDVLGVRGREFEMAVPFACWFEAGTEAARNAGLSALLVALGLALASDRRLGGVADWMEWGGPEEADDLIGEGLQGYRVARVTATVSYMTGANPLEDI